MQSNPDSTVEEQTDAKAETEASVGAEGPVDAGQEQLEEIATLKQEFAAMKDRYLRQAADFQNFRKRAIEDRALSVEIGRIQVALPMVDVLDDLRRSVQAAEESDDPFAQGMRLVYEKFVTELGKLGIRSMVVLGERFDEERHEALMQRTAPEGKAPGTVLAEIQKGYMIDDKVLRHARVVVAK